MHVSVTGFTNKSPCQHLPGPSRLAFRCAGKVRLDLCAGERLSNRSHFAINNDGQWRALVHKATEIVSKCKSAKACAGQTASDIVINKHLEGATSQVCHTWQCVTVMGEHLLGHTDLGVQSAHLNATATDCSTFAWFMIC
jgi:hypothetical protein